MHQCLSHQTQAQSHPKVNLKGGSRRGSSWGNLGPRLTLPQVYIGNFTTSVTQDPPSSFPWEDLQSTSILTQVCLKMIVASVAQSHLKFPLGCPQGDLQPFHPYKFASEWPTASPYPLMSLRWITTSTTLVHLDKNLKGRSCRSLWGKTWDNPWPKEH